MTALSDQEYIERLRKALRSSVDAYGEAIIESGREASYEGIKDLLRPLMLVGKIPGAYGWLTNSSVHYMPLGLCDGETGAREFILTVADGSGFIAGRFDSGVSMELFVGREGEERYGEALERLSVALEAGYLPILRTEYKDAGGVTYRQESFVTRIDDSPALAAFVKVTASGGAGGAGNAEGADKVRLRFKLSGGEFAARGNRLHRRGAEEWVHALFSDGATIDGGDLVFDLDLSQGEKSACVVWFNRPAPVRERAVDAAAHERAKAELVAYWGGILAQGAVFSVPDERAMRAQKNLLIQNLLLNNRYSIGNLYETVFNAEACDALQALGLFGFTEAYRAGLEQMTLGTNIANWEKALRLKHVAYYAMLTGDFTLAERHERRLVDYMRHFERQMNADPRGLLEKEPGGTDISDPSSMIYSLHFQTDAWRGLRDIARVWERMGRLELSRKAKALAERLHGALRKVVDECKISLSDGSLFVPVRLLDPSERAAYDPITATTQGSYWLLVAPYAFASGFFPPGGQEAGAILRYLHKHGAVFLGMLRFNYLGVAPGESKADGMPGMRAHGVDNAYLTSYVKFLADNDEVDRLILTFYGKLAHGMTRETFVCGEGEELDVVDDPRYRSMYLPPNSANNAAFFHALRLLLIREELDGEGAPAALHLCPATPRAWLEDGKSIDVKEAPTLFGPVSFSIRSAIGHGDGDGDGQGGGEGKGRNKGQSDEPGQVAQVAATISLPSRLAPSAVKLRLRTPGKRRLAAVWVNGKEHARFDSAREEIDLSGLRGVVEVRAEYAAHLE